MITRWFHVASYVKYPMMLLGAWRAFPELVHRTPQCLEHIGLGLFFFGMGLTLDGLKAERAPSAREIRSFQNEKQFKFSLIFSSSWAVLSFCLGVFFFAVPLFWPSVPASVYEQIKGIGLGTFSMSVGALVLEKQRYTRFLAYQHRGD